VELRERGVVETDDASARPGQRVLTPAALLARQDTFRGFGDGLAMAFELAMVPFIFGFGGYALDRWLGTWPWFMILFALLAIVGLFVRSWYEYEQRMQALEANAPWAARKADPGGQAARKADPGGQAVRKADPGGQAARKADLGGQAARKADPAGQAAPQAAPPATPAPPGAQGGAGEGSGPEARRR
jgi:F0F1-type ATP synthase assembly protein I